MNKKIWAYRGFILGNVRREFEARYRNSLLGSLWSIVQPLSMIVVYTFIFSNIMSARLTGVDSSFAYSIYLCVGTLTWGFFSEITSRAQTVFIENANIIKKLNFPRICLPVIVVLNAGLNFFIFFSLFTIFLALTGNFPGWVYLGMFPLLLLEVAFAIGLGVTLGVLNVFFRDVSQLFSVLLQFWFWFTPIVYPIDILPESVRLWVKYNPMATLISAYQDIFSLRFWPNWEALWPLALLAFLFLLVGYTVFRKLSIEMVDEL